MSNDETIADSRSNECKDWPTAILALEKGHRQSILAGMHLVVVWRMWLVKVCGWTGEEVLEWVDKHHTLELFAALGPVDARLVQNMPKLSMIDLYFVDKKVLDRVSLPLQDRFLADVVNAVQQYSKRSIFDREFPWDDMRGVINFVVESWQRNDYAHGCDFREWPREPGNPYVATKHPLDG